MADDCLELEHVIGYSGNYTNTLQAHPTEKGVFICNIGAVVVVADVNDPHNQDFLRGHDDQVTCLSFSPSGRFIASGQRGSSLVKSNEAPVIVWDFASRREVYKLHGHVGEVTSLSFSADDRFLATTGADDRTCVWDMQNGEIMNNFRAEAPCTFLTWGPYQIDSTKRSGRISRYTLCAAYGQSMKLHFLDFDVRSMQYTLSTSNFSMPSQGLHRTYFAGGLSRADNQFLLTGSKEGDFLVFNIDNQVFRHNVPVSSNGLICMAMDDRYVYCGNGDGKLKKLEGHDKMWNIVDEISLSGKVMSISICAGGEELLAGTSSGKIYRIRLSDFATVVHAEGHMGGVNSVAFGRRSDVFTTVSDDGEVRVWDLSDYSVVSRAHIQQDSPVSVVFTEEETVVTGWQSGALRCYDAHNGEHLWTRNNSHRGPIKTIAVSPQCIMTGGDDCALRVWSRATHEYLSQFQDHSKPIVCVIQDNTNPNLIHSVALDRAIFTFDLKKQQRINFKLASKEISVTCMSQRRDSELELVTGLADGRCLFWDCDYPEPVKQIADPNRVRLNSVDVSPSGRFLLTAADDFSIKVWNIDEERLIAVGVGHSGKVTRAVWSTDEKQIISVGLDSAICVWNWFA